MGAGASSANAQKKQSRVIDKQIATDQQKQHKRLLLLGSGECGKSTILRQMRLIHGNGFTVEELLSQLDAMKANLIDGIAMMVHFCRQQGLEFPEDYEELAEKFEPPQCRTLKLNATLLEEILLLWNDPAMKTAFARRNEFALPDQMDYFIQRSDQLLVPGFIPTPNDILRMRVRSTGVLEIRFVAQNQPFCMIDVGGQRAERRKWISQFDSVDSIFFVAALSDYTRVLWEDNTTNRLKEAIALFQQIINLDVFINMPIILFLNKDDLFRRLLPVFQLSACFTSYREETNDYTEALKYIVHRFTRENKNPSRRVYIHVTTATDTAQVKFVFEACQDVVLRSDLGRAGLI